MYECDYGSHRRQSETSEGKSIEKSSFNAFAESGKIEVREGCDTRHGEEQTARKLDRIPLSTLRDQETERRRSVNLGFCARKPVDNPLF